MARQALSRISVWLRTSLVVVCVCLVLGLTGLTAAAQNEDLFGGSDPVKLFERGQSAHARGEFSKAIDFYDEAIKVKPEFAEAEFQRANALVSLNRFKEAETGFRRTLELRNDWSLAYSSLGSLLVRLDRGAEAEPVLRQAIKFDPQNYSALRHLADLRLRVKDPQGALQLARRASEDKDAPANAWVLRGIAERLSGDKAAALTSLTKALELEPANLPALLERAEIRIAQSEGELAILDLRLAEPLAQNDKVLLARLVANYKSLNKTDEAQRIARAAGLEFQNASGETVSANVNGTPEEIEAANSDDPEVARKALEKLLEKNPDNPKLLGRLGSLYRTINPDKSLEFFRQANKIDPSSADYAVGYGAALIQKRRFSEAASILVRVVKAEPDHYAAHANFATALYGLKQFQAALDEYRWLATAKPELSVIHYFIATAHDNLGEFEQALAAYELFLSRADTKANQLEIEKVKLRLPGLRRQIKLGEGVKRKQDQRAKQ